jgi:hypothetical protein
MQTEEPDQIATRPRPPVGTVAAALSLVLLIPLLWLFVAFNVQFRQCVPLKNGLALGYEAVFDLRGPYLRPIAVPKFGDGTPLIRDETWAIYVTDTTVHGWGMAPRSEADYRFAWRADTGLVRQRDDPQTYDRLVAEAGHANWDIEIDAVGTGWLLQELLRRRAPDRPRCPTALLTW